MKKILSAVLALLMIGMLSVSVFAAYPDTVHTVTLTDKVDVLDGKAMTMVSPKGGTKNVKDLGAITFTPDSNGCLTDGVVCYDFGTTADGTVSYVNTGIVKSYLNTAWYNNTKVDGLAPRTDFYNGFPYPEEKLYSFGGVNTKYYYYIEAKELNCKADSFALFMSAEDRVTTTVEGELVNPGWMDAEFDILVSTDGGKTYQVAYSSIEYKKDAEGNVISFCGQEKTATCDGSTKVVSKKKAGEFKGYDGSSTTDYFGYEYMYRVIEGNFNKEYTGVTDIVYACKKPRALTSDYAVRLTEFDVYSTVAPVVPATGDGSVNLLAAVLLTGAALTAGTVVIRRRKEEI